jgi:hypothetical protein
MGPLDRKAVDGGRRAAAKELNVGRSSKIVEGSTDEDDE